MANVLTAILPKILARALPVLRQNAVMPRLVTTDYNITPQERGNIVTIQKSAAQTAAAVTNSNTPPSNSDNTPTSVAVTLDKWYETRFHLSDKEVTQINTDSQFVPGQMAESVKALVNQVDVDLLALYKEVYNNTGAAATTPFASEATLITDWTKGAFKGLKDNLCPLDDISVVVDTAAEANLLSLALFYDADRRGDQFGIIDAEIGKKLGARWFADQNIVDHDGNAPTGWLVNDAAHATGAKTITVDTGSNTPVAGDTFVIAGDTQEYVVTSATATVVSHEPAGLVALADNAALTFIADNTPNLAFHKTAFALASAPLADVGSLGLGNMSVIADPATGLALRLEVRRDYKQTTFDMDILYGVKCVRPELAHRING